MSEYIAALPRIVIVAMMQIARIELDSWKLCLTLGYFIIIREKRFKFEKNLLSQSRRRHCSTPPLPPVLPPWTLAGHVAGNWRHLKFIWNLPETAKVENQCKSLETPLTYQIRDDSYANLCLILTSNFQIIWFKHYLQMFSELSSTELYLRGVCWPHSCQMLRGFFHPPITVGLKIHAYIWKRKTTTRSNKFRWLILILHWRCLKRVKLILLNAAPVYSVQLQLWEFQLSSYQFLIRSRFRLLDKIPQILTSKGKVPLILI